MRSPKRWWTERWSARRVVPHEDPLWLMQWWLVTAIVVLAVLLSGAAAMWLLGVWAPIPRRVPNPDQLRLERIKTGLTVAAGVAAGVTLLLALRRQAWSERAQRFAESDALEQRTTALYVAAAEQLGSDKAAVRLAGLYVLERIGQDSPKLRQTVFDVWCAYLRMPYTPPIDVLRRNAKVSPERPAPDAEPPDRAVEAERRQELEVRLTAQRLLGAHLSRGLAEARMSTYWLTNEGNRLIVDLVGAVLVDFNASACALGRADFSGAQFHGDTNLREAQFHADTDLVGAQFHADADLIAAQFHGYAILHRAQFHGDAYLGGEEFHGYVFLGEAQFHGDAYMNDVDFDEDVYMEDAQFDRAAELRGARFHGSVHMRGAEFTGDLDMTGALATSAANLPDGWVLSDATAENDTLRPVVRAEDVPAEVHGPDVAT